MVEYIFEYEICAAAIMTVLIILFLMKHNYPSTSNKLYFGLLVLDLAAVIFDVVSIFTISHTDKVPVWLNTLVNMLYLWSFNGCALLFCVYVIFITKRGVITKANRIVCSSILVLETILIATTPFTKLIIYFDENRIYSHGPAFILLYILSYSLLIYVLIMFFLYRKNLNKYQILAVVTFTVATIAAVTIQMIDSRYLIQGLVSAFFLLIVYVSLQNPDDYMDKKTDCFNRNAFNDTLDVLFAKGEKFTLVVFTINDFRYISRVLGSAAGSDLLDNLAMYLIYRYGKNNVYHLISSNFAIIVDEEKETVDGVISDIREHLNTPYMIDNMEILLTPCICTVYHPDFAETPEDITDAIDYTLNEMSSSQDSETIRVSGSALDIKHRENKIVHAIRTAIHNEDFMVYYQPIFDTERLCFNSAEALIRLNDYELGFISPDEFIPLAEKNGLIVEVGEIVFRKVCRFLSSCDTEKLGIKYIEVNLSVVQCMQENLASSMLEIMQEYGISPEMINFEITETSASVNENALTRNMYRLLESGSSFSMDDYGTGFSTANYLISLPMSIVKIDKSILWPAMKDESAMTILSHTIAMLKDLDKKIVVEGVENSEMASTLINLGCDYLQGYYYSRPVPENEYIDFLEKQPII